MSEQNRPSMQPAQGPSYVAPRPKARQVLLLLILCAVIAAALFYRRGTPGGPMLVNWRTDFQTAMNESVQTGKPLLMDFTAEWCPPCQQMKKSVWTDRRVADAVNREFVPVLIDVDTQKSLAAEFRVNAIPTLKIINAGQERYSLSGYHEPDRVIALADAYANPKSVTVK